MPITTRSRSQVQGTIPFKQKKPRAAKETKIESSPPAARSCGVPPKLSKDKKNDAPRPEEQQRTTKVSLSPKKVTSLPLSPRKVASLQLSPREVASLPLSPRKRRHSGGSNKENEDVRVPPPSSPTKLIRPSPDKSPLKGIRLDKLNIRDSSLGPSPSLSSPRTAQSPRKELKKIQLCRQQDESFTRAKRALHTSLPDRLLCRDKEVESIQGFLHEHILKSKPGSLYISGAPGTGKTACLKYILEEDEELYGVQRVFVNCMSIRQSHGIYAKILKEIGGGKTSAKTNLKDAQRQLQKKLTSAGPIILLVLDEIDHLDSKGQEVLYTMFEWPSLPKSRLVLLGIANALDLTDRILPRLQARPKCAPKLLHFQPYTKNQIVSILQDRLQASGGGNEVLDPIALQLCARKVAAVSGDIRKALDVCRRAVEVVESDVRTQTVLSPKALRKPTSPSKSPKKSPVKRVTLQTISTVLGEVYGSNIVSSKNQSQTFPLQQKLVICTLLLTVKEGKKREITLGKLHETYSKICQKRQVPAVDQSEFSALCQLIETRGIMGIKAAKDTRQTKINLKLSQKEVEFALQDKVFLSSILQQGIPDVKKQSS